MMNPFSLQGKRILIVGGSSGIGRATSRLCSQMEATCYVVGRRAEHLKATQEEMLGDTHSFLSLDITDKKSVEDAILEFPDFDGVVFSAGIGAMKPLLFCSREDFDRVFNLNFFATVEFLRQLVKKKKVKKMGSVVIVSSVGGVFDITEGNCIYGTSKAALNSWMKFCALELAPKKIRVNSVNPGMVKTPFNSPDILTAEQLAADAAKYPLKRFGEPEEIANAIVYLLSEASSWTTGTSLVVDGGISLT